MGKLIFVVKNAVFRFLKRNLENRFRTLCVDGYLKIYFHASVRKILGNIAVQYSFPLLCLCSPSPLLTAATYLWH